jgi:cell fate regulator YaaT (PSP1 superfamily)
VGLASQETFEIIDGVRRAKAAELAGKATVVVQVDDGTGRLSSPIEVQIDPLRSPHKSTIDLATQAALDRWLDVFRRAKQGSMPPPIMVRRGSKAMKISDVEFERRGSPGAASDCCATLTP